MEVHTKSILCTQSFAMNGGDGHYSYVKNSLLQGVGFNAIKEILEESIAEKLDIQSFRDETKTFNIADFGCSVGTNTFNVVQTIIDAVSLKYKSTGLQLSSQIPEYHVFFSDQVSNDFNTLFASLPPKRNYYATGVPGSFYTRLFPKASLHFVHSSFALNWLSRIPQEVIDTNSPAWNKGKISFENATEEVLKAYSAQHVKDMEMFLCARAEEIVIGGLMALLIPIIPNGGSSSRAPRGSFLLEPLGSCLMDMANMGIVSEATVDSFNLPDYISSPQEVEASVERSKCFNIEKMVEIYLGTEEKVITNNARIYGMHIRAVMEGIIKKQFGSEIIDELFDRYYEKLEESISIRELVSYNKLFVLLKRKADHITT